MPDHGRKQTLADFLPKVLHRGETIPVIQPAMAAFALSRVETHRNAASTAQPSDPPDEFITGHDISYISVRMRMNLVPFVKMLSWLRTYETWGPPSGCFDRANSLGDPRPHIKGRVSRLSERGQSSSQTMRSRSCGPSPMAAGKPPPAYSPVRTLARSGIRRARRHQLPHLLHDCTQQGLLRTAPHQYAQADEQTEQSPRGPVLGDRVANLS